MVITKELLMPLKLWSLKFKLNNQLLKLMSKLKLMLNKLCYFLLMVKLKKLLTPWIIFQSNLWIPTVKTNTIFLPLSKNNLMQMAFTPLKETILMMWTNHLKLLLLKTSKKKLKQTDNKLKISVKKKIKLKPKKPLSNSSNSPKENTKTWTSLPLKTPLKKPKKSELEPVLMKNSLKISLLQTKKKPKL